MRPSLAAWFVPALLTTSLAACRDAPADPAPPAVGASASDDGCAPRSVFLFIGDGMGAEQARAMRYFADGDVAPSSFEAFPVVGAQRTARAGGGVTDSAAASTAMATGHKVDDGVLSLAIPGDGAALKTALEVQQARGRATGLVTTATAATDATPAGFGAHQPSRDEHAAIGDDYLTRSRPDVIMGAPSSGLTTTLCAAAGYATASTSNELAALDLAATPRLCGLFEGVTPSLPDRTTAAIEVLERDLDGFFVLIEHEGADSGGHGNDLGAVVAAVLELRDAVDVARAWAADRDDVLIVVTGDHETGGLVVTEDAPVAGEVPGHAFGTRSHTGVDVPVYAWGCGAWRASGVYENTHVFDVLTRGATGDDEPSEAQGSGPAR